MIIWLASYPRSGNTFFRVILNSVFGLQSYSIHNDKDIGSDEQTSGVVGHTMLPENFNINTARESKNVFYIKTHEHHNEKVNPADKVIYLIRDGRESTLSFMKHQKIYGKKDKTLLDVIYGDTWIGSWGEHIKSWERFPQKNILYIYFEELTDKPLDQISKISDFLKITTVNNQIPTFDELKTINPKFFRSGKKDSWKDIYSKEEHIAFWYKHFEPMKKHGYIDSIPEIFNNPEIASLYKAIETDKIYIKDEAIFSQTTDEYERQIKTLKSTIENSRKELCTQTKKSEVIERKLNTITGELAQLTNIKFSSSPIQKYHAYKQMLHVYHTSTKQPYTSREIFILPTDDLYNHPDKQFCISEDEHPIMIFQVGKVGSSTMAKSLKNNVKNLPVYQIHNIETAEELLKKENALGHKGGYYHFTTGHSLKSVIQKNPEIRWKVIVGVREPIKRWVSDIFQNINERYAHFYDSDGKIKQKELIDFIHQTLENEPMQTWFDEEFKKTFGVDVFQYNFDKVKGYTIIKAKNVDILIYQLEKLKNSFPIMMQEFLSLELKHPDNANESTSKPYADVYRTVLQHLKFDEDYLKKFYKKPITSHFYSGSNIENFINTWKK